MPVQSADELLDTLERLRARPGASRFRWYSSLDGISSRLRLAEPVVRSQIVAALRGMRLADYVVGQGANSRCDRDRDLFAVVQRIAVVVRVLTSGDPSISAMNLDVDYTRFDAAELVRRTVAEFAGLATDRGVELSIDAPGALCVEADPGKLATVLLNLLFNAFKHTDAGGQVVCELMSADGDARLQVADSGPGIPIYCAESIFDGFNLHDRSVCCVTPVAGFALCQSRELMRLQGGDLELCNPGRSGARFEARWPLCAPTGIAVSPNPPPLSDQASRVVQVAVSELEAEAALTETHAPASDKLLVLIVDASRSVQRTLKDGLEPRYAVACALDCETGRELAARLNPDLVVIDAAFGPAARDFTYWLWDHAEAADVPVLALVASGDPGTVVRLLESGVRDALQKPFSLPELVARVDRMLDEKRGRDVLNTTIGQHERDLLALANEVAEHQQSLERAVVEAQSARRYAENASRIKSNFLRMMSHELKTPITAIALQMRLFEHALDGPDVPTLRDGVSRTTRSLRRLTYLVDTVLEWARVESGRVKLERKQVDLGELVRDVLTEVRPLAERKRVGVELIGEPQNGPGPHTDAKLLRLVLFNLATRAVHRTSEGAVQLEVSRGDRVAVVIVRDDGPRLPPDETRCLFDPVWAGGNHHRGGQGTGFGLHVVRDIARALGADVTAKQCSAGTCLQLSVPMDTAGKEQ